jgi:hypothetical protein
MLVKHCAKILFHEFGFWFEQRGPVKPRCFFYPRIQKSFCHPWPSSALHDKSGGIC